MIVKCVMCGKEFEAQKSTAKYCSQECINAHRREQRANREQEPHKKGIMAEKTCAICGAKFRPKTPAANLRKCCYDCMPDGVQLTRGAFLAKIKIQRGGKCERCGYDKCIKALEFHHLDPNKKDFTISNDHFKLDEAVEESKKCILICANCHRELHDNLWNVEELKRKEEVDLGINTETE